jgi:type VI secretion system protein VasG
VVRCDEVDKAHPDVMEMFYQVFDQGMLEDGEGREIDFKNTVILLTCNAGAEAIVKLCADPDTRPDPDPLASAIRPALQQLFPAALLGRMTVVPYYPITPEMLQRIARLQLERIAERARSQHGATFVYGDDVVAAVVSQCNEPESGARAIDRVVERSLLPELGAEILSRLMRGDPFERVEVTVGPAGFRYVMT